MCVCLCVCGSDKPLQPRNVRLTSVGQGLKVSWEPPNQLDGRPVERYNIGYGKSMRSLRFIKVDKDRRSEVLEDVGKIWRRGGGRGGVRGGGGRGGGR